MRWRFPRKFHWTHSLLFNWKKWAYNPEIYCYRMKNVQQISFDQLFTNYASAELPPFRSGHLDVKDAQCDKKMMGVKFDPTLCRVRAPRHPNAPNWCPKNATFFKSIQICLVIWNWSGTNFLEEWRIWH